VLKFKILLNYIVVYLNNHFIRILYNFLYVYSSEILLIVIYHLHKLREIFSEREDSRYHTLLYIKFIDCDNLRKMESEMRSFDISNIMISLNDQYYYYIFYTNRTYK